ncbi:MAG TPA: 16S rRNA (cytidine(1402)-2'-O)-methyltransferase [Candidatus Paceibacterota bacterium]|nr:16S rRNA (cytidine(1402)-2'-O)-methyltransferase [Candidatus Pacearchaeota archaeon]HRZ51338.1 16S rRNA (cytidine(1402)-2'-O)-methyltransferase [Candidatus Paceibacterota bacterium]HSA37060.1 16S rRNA (cytidine(1402)-2'-O)-methyltransferase [Candidatus Paceibacterota bacterium]
MPGKLYIVATPIGNLEDMTFRAVETLKSVDLVLCEDTRVALRLFNHFAIEKTTESYHQHSTLKKIGRIAGLLREGKNLALVSDAGTPGISDPGNQLIESLIQVFGTEIKIIPIPGPSAVTAALSICGFGSDRFIFAGFPPAKNKRKKFFEEALAYSFTALFYESTYRIIRTLEDIKALEPDKSRRIVICRELTKKFETIYRGTIEEAANDLKKGIIKGEFVFVLEGRVDKGG